MIRKLCCRWDESAFGREKTIPRNRSTVRSLAVAAAQMASICACWSDVVEVRGLPVVCLVTPPDLAGGRGCLDPLHAAVGVARLRQYVLAIAAQIDPQAHPPGARVIPGLLPQKPLVVRVVPEVDQAQGVKVQSFAGSSTASVRLLPRSTITKRCRHGRIASRAAAWRVAST